MNLPLTRLSGRRSRTDYCPSSASYRKCSRYVKKIAYFLPQVCSTFCWLTMKMKIWVWKKITASDEVLDYFYRVFQHDCIEKENYTEICNSSFNLGSDFQSGQYKNPSSVWYWIKLVFHCIIYTKLNQCFTKYRNAAISRATGTLELIFHCVQRL